MTSGAARAKAIAQLECVLEFADATIAGPFERYLKTGSGRAFAMRHFGDV